MTIWLDGDSIPRDLRATILRRARTTGVCFVASKSLPDIPPELSRLVPPGQDSVDKAIESAAMPGDIVITRDLPFAERIAMKGISVLNDKGDVFTRENVAERRSLRDRAAELRLLGIAPQMARASSRSAKDVKNFADALDRLMTRLSRQE
jgi:uncharacterized protein YaiI (UPF0178 family)